MIGSDMMARRGVLELLVGTALALALGGCSGKGSTLRYRLTVEVDTPSGLKTGSSVLEYEYPSKTGLSYGQAPFVDLGNGRYVFALIDQMSGPWGVFRYPDLRPPIPRDDVPWSEFDRANELRPKAVLKLADYPKLVTFDDINDPKTVREVKPSSVRQIIFEVVDQDEPLSEGIEELLKWIGPYPETRLTSMKPGSGLQSVEDAPLNRLLSNGHFVFRGFRK